MERRTTGTALAGLTALLAAVVTTVAPGALAASPVPQLGDREVVVYLSAAAGGSSFGVFRRAVDGGPVTQLVAPDPRRERLDLAVSRDGSRYAYTEALLGPDGTPLRDRLVVRDVAGPFSRAVVDIPASEQFSITAPALSPDGRTLAWTVGSFPLGRPPVFQLARAPVLGGTPASLVGGSAGLVEPAFLTPSLLLATDVRPRRSLLRTLPLAGGAQRAVAGTPGDAYATQVSPSGAALVFQVDDPDGESVLTRTAPLALTAGSLVVGPVRQLTDGRFDASPAFRRDSTGVVLTRVPVGDLAGDLWTVLPGAPAASLGETPRADELEVIVGAIDATPPGAVGTTGPARLQGTGISLPLDVWPTDSDWSGTYARRTGAGSGGSAVVRFNRPGARFVDPGLVPGRTYTYVLRAVDSSGNLGPASAPRTVRVPLR